MVAHWHIAEQNPRVVLVTTNSALLSSHVKEVPSLRPADSIRCQDFQHP